MPAAEPRIVYTPWTNATPKGELDALASVYAFVLEKYQKRQQSTEHVSTPVGHDDYERIANE